MTSPALCLFLSLYYWLWLVIVIAAAWLRYHSRENKLPVDDQPCDITSFTRSCLFWPYKDKKPNVIKHFWKKNKVAQWCTSFSGINCTSTILATKIRQCLFIGLSHCLVVVHSVFVFQLLYKDIWHTAAAMLTHWFPFREVCRFDAWVRKN